MKRALLFGILLMLCQLASPSWAQEKRTEPPENLDHPPYPSEAHIIFQWNYSCPSNRGCSFNCTGLNGASAVTALDVYLGTIPVGKDQSTYILFYNYSTQFVPRGNGFSLSTGIAVLSCQVNGMKVDYSGPAKE